MTAFQPVVRTSNGWLHLAGAADYAGSSRAEMVRAVEQGELDAVPVADDPTDALLRMYDVDDWTRRRLRVAV